MKADLFFDKIADLVFLKNLRKKSEVCELYKRLIIQGIKMAKNLKTSFLQQKHTELRWFKPNFAKTYLQFFAIKDITYGSIKSIDLN